MNFILRIFAEIILNVLAFYYFCRMYFGLGILLLLCPSRKEETWTRFNENMDKLREALNVGG